MFFSTLSFSVVDVLKLKTVSKTRIIIFAVIFVYIILVILNDKPLSQKFILSGKDFYILFIKSALNFSQIMPKMRSAALPSPITSGTLIEPI